MNSNKDYRYHVFGLKRGNSKNIENYVAEGASGACADPQVFCKSGILAFNLCQYMQDDSLGSNLQYLSFSFEPTCERVVYNGDIYRTQKLTENQQKHFLRLVQEYVMKHTE